MNKQDVYRSLEEKMLSYKDYADIPVRLTSETLVPIQQTPQLQTQQVDSEMRTFCGEKIYVREDVARRLEVASRYINRRNSGISLEVVYGYRVLEIQRKRFDEQIDRLRATIPSTDLRAAAHRYIAAPEVAGHPAGAAVDVQLISDGKPLDFGTKIHEFIPDSYTFSPFISSRGWRNRQLLRQSMLQAGFAPFDGEWWHFSYGDKEWARYYDRTVAYYDQLPSSVVNTIQR